MVPGFEGLCRCDRRNDGRLRGEAALIRGGLYGSVAGLILFVVLGAFFEGVLGLDGLQVPLGRLMLPICLVGVGVVLIAVWVWSAVGRLKSPPGDHC